MTKMESFLEHQHQAERIEGPPPLSLTPLERFMTVAAFAAMLVIVACLIVIYGAR